MVGAAVSLVIEITQFIFASGYSDVDDLIFNTAGAALGGWAAARLTSLDRATLTWAIAAGSVVLIVPFLAAMVL